MKSAEKNAGKELYRELRAFSWERLWEEEVPRFDKASPKERNERVALVRAVGVVFLESGDSAQKEDVRQWLLGLLHDPCEKIRRYAMAALPKIGAGAGDEKELLSLLQTTSEGREKKFVSKALEKIGGAATLEILRSGNAGLLPQAEQKIMASLARAENPSVVRMDGVIADFSGLRVHLRGRRGLEGMVRDEVVEYIQRHGKFRVADVRNGLVALTPMTPFSLSDIYALRCFGSVGIIPVAPPAQSIDDLAARITSPVSRRVWQTFTEGTIRYRLNFISKGHQRSVVRLLADKVYQRCPEILNDARDVTWTVDIYPGRGGDSVELRPNLTPDPRFYYRQKDVPAASHPHLAACMARLAGKQANEIVWDPFCGSGLELVERALLGGVRHLYGTDLSADAIDIAQANLAAAGIPVSADFACADFRDYAEKTLKPESVTLVITNPPLGMRVPVNNLRGLIEELFEVAATVLKPGGRLVLVNPIFLEKAPRGLQLESRQVVDLGGFDCRMEKYVKPTDVPRR